MVTSANDREIVQSLLSRGVLDYLVKPFAFDRFRQALDKFVQAQRLLSGGRDSLDQGAIDRLMCRREQPEPRGAQMGKGLNAATLERVRAFLSGRDGQALTSEEIAEGVGLSRITIRRYVNYMVEQGELSSSIDYQTGGPALHPVPLCGARPAPVTPPPPLFAPRPAPRGVFRARSAVLYLQNPYYIYISLTEKNELCTFLNKRPCP